MNRIKTLRTLAQMKQADLAKHLSVGQGTISNWETGRTEPDHDSLIKMAQLFGTSTDHILCLEQAGQTRSKVVIPVLGEVAAGIPIEAIEDIVDYEELSPDMSAMGEYFGLRLKGQSMEPRMCDGDVVIVKRQSSADSGDIAVVLVNGDAATVKKVRRSQSGMSLIPLNPAYDPVFYTNEEIDKYPVSIIGIVVELRAKFHGTF